jgi:tetratricopeptide (TPR) repeat protein
MFFNNILTKINKFVDSFSEINNWAWYNRGNALKKLGRYEDALNAYLQKPLRVYPQGSNLNIFVENYSS